MALLTSLLLTSSAWNLLVLALVAIFAARLSPPLLGSAAANCRADTDKKRRKRSLEDMMDDGGGALDKMEG